MHYQVSRWNQHWITLNTPSHLAGRVPAKRAMPLSSTLTSKFFHIAQKIKNQKTDVIGVKRWLGLFIMFHQSWERVELWKKSLSATTQKPFHIDKSIASETVISSFGHVSIFMCISCCSGSQPKLPRRAWNNGTRLPAAPISQQSPWLVLLLCTSIIDLTSLYLYSFIKENWEECHIRREQGMLNWWNKWLEMCC